MGQTKVKRAKSRIFVKVGWFDPLMGGFDQPKYFCLGATLMGVAAHPNFQVTNKNYLQYAFSDFKMLYAIWVWAHLKIFHKF